MIGNTRVCQMFRQCCVPLGDQTDVAPCTRSHHRRTFVYFDPYSVCILGVGQPRQHVYVQVGDLIDMHAYVGPNAPLPTGTRASVLGEFGGLGLRLDSHLWIPEDSFCYEMMTSAAILEVLAKPQSHPWVASSPAFPQFTAISQDLSSTRRSSTRFRGGKRGERLQAH